MSNNFTLNASAREPENRGAVRRLRREGRIPGIIYGGHGEATAISVPQNELMRNLEFETFFSQVITVKIGKKNEEVILKDLQHHPAKSKILHLDMQRIVAGEAITVQIPLHFMGEETCPGVKESDGVVEHHLNELEISALPRNLPEYIEVDLSELEVEQSIHLSDITLPEGVEPIESPQEQDYPLVSIHHPRVEAVEEEAEEAAEGLEGEEEAETPEGDSGEAADSDGEEEE